MTAAFDMWNVSALSMQQTLTCKMRYELAILFIMIGLHSTHLLVDATSLVIERAFRINCPIAKCSAGYHSVCQSNGQPLCKQCSDGFYSSHASRIKKCLRCSRCGENEFEVQSCSPITNVICQKCRECYSPFPFVLKSCSKTSDTICGICSSALGLDCEEEKNPEERSSRREDRDKGNNEQYLPAHHTKRKFQVLEIPVGVRTQPHRPSPTTISLSLSSVTTTSVCTSIHSIETSTRSTLETSQTANPLPQTKKSPTRGLETAVYTETSEKKSLRSKRSHAKNETTEDLKHPPGVSPKLLETSPTKAAISRMKTSDPSSSSTVRRVRSQFSITIFVISVALVVFVPLMSLLLAEEIKRKGYRCTQQGSRGRFSQLCQAEDGKRRPRCPQSRNCCLCESASSTTARNGDQTDRQATRALTSPETDDLAPSSFQNTVISYDLSEDVKSVYEVFPEDHSMWLELLFVTSAHGTFDSTGGTLTHPNSDVCINIEPGTFPHGKQQPIFFHVIYNDTYMIRDIPETNERTLISPVIKCPQSWEKIPSSSERSCHSKAWFSIKKDNIVIKTKVFSIWSIFFSGVGGSKRKRVIAYFSKPNPASNLISLRCYIYSDNEDSKRKVKRFEEEHFPGSKSSTERPLKLHSDNQDIAVWLDKEALTERGWMLDGTPGSQNYTYEMAHKNGFRCKSACQFAVKPIAECSTRVEDFSCPLYFQQNGHTKDFIYVNPGISLLPPQTTSEDNGKSSSGAQGQHRFDQAAKTVICANSSHFVIPEDLHRRFDETVTRQDCIRLCNHIVNDWKMILQHLGVEESVLENVDANHARVNEKSYQGLLEWTRLAGTQEATIGNLCNALRAAGCTEAIEKLSSRDDGARLHGHAIPETV